MPTLEANFSQNSTAAEYAGHYFDHLHELLHSLDRSAIEAAVEALVACCEAGRTTYFLGNGGSAAIASHYANDFTVGAASPGRPLFRAVSLLDNNAVVSCVANDFGYEHVFSKQLEPVLHEGDVVFALSVSGNSANIIHAAELAKERRAIVIGVTGFDGGQLRALADISLHVDTPRGEYGPVEDVFQIIDHLIVSYLQLSRRGHL